MFKTKKLAWFSLNESQSEVENPVAIPGFFSTSMNKMAQPTMALRRRRIKELVH